MKLNLSIIAAAAASLLSLTSSWAQPLMEEPASSVPAASVARQKQILRDDSATRWGISMNVVDLVSLGVPNITVQYGVSRRVSLIADAKWNGWSWHKDGREIVAMNRQQTYALGARWWPWYVYSGWWVCGKAQYQEYDRAGSLFAFENINEKGDAFGAGLSGGYALMVSKHFTVEFGVGLWGGLTWYDRYECIYAPAFSDCAHIGPHVGHGRKFFVRPNDILISVMWNF